MANESSSTKQDLQTSARKVASKQLDRVKEKIMHTWESRVRDSVASAPSKSTPVLRNMLPELLNNLVSNISTDSGGANLTAAGRIGKEHGEQRASLLDYRLSEVLHEYRILREVIFEVLEQENISSSAVRNLILNVLDEGIEKAIEQFSNIRSEELKRSNRDLEHFAAIAAHDLKSPLATITSFAELLDDELKGKINDEEAKYLQTIIRSSARMILLIDRLLEYSTVGREMKVFENVSTNQIVGDVIENLKTDIEKANARIYYSNLPVVFGDSSLLSQLIQNFISNSLKFRVLNRPLEIHIDAKASEYLWTFSIRDNGTGFNPKDKENIFSLFKQSTTQPRTGLGIGLATARKIIELHGGKVWAESQPGTGSTFFFTLPKSGVSRDLH